jgi:tyrosinase
MSPLAPTRREVVVTTAAAAGLLLAPALKARSQALLIRPDLTSTTGKTMVGLYASAVKAMQDPAINYPPQPQSWTFQAYMHAVPLNPFDPAVSGGAYQDDLKTRINDIYGNPAPGTPQAAWKQAASACWGKCEHASPYFTTWHRWYLYYFERICRKMCAQSEFTLPYWNYASDNGPSLQLPAIFQQYSQDTSNPNHLYFDDRGLGFADAASTGPQNVAMNNNGYLPYSLIQYGPALGAQVMFPSDDFNYIPADPTDPTFIALGFSGRLECIPHDNVHSYVGGWMQNVPSAAGDPLFFVHHCQIDRLYASWEAASGTSYNWGSSDTQPDENTWKTTTANYVDENGQLVTKKLGDAIDTSSLGYQYDNLAKPPSPQVVAAGAPAIRRSARLTLAAAQASGFRVQSGGSSVTLAPTPPPVAARPAERPGASVPTAPSSQTLILQGIKLLRRPPAPLAVFINMPKSTPPRLHNPYYVGTLNLFNFDLGSGNVRSHASGNMQPDHAMPGPTARFDVTNVLAQQRAKGLWDGRTITVTISTIGADAPGEAAYVTIESVALVP